MRKAEKWAFWPFSGEFDSTKGTKRALSGFSENSKVAKCEFSQIQLNQALGTDGNLRLPMYSTYEAANNNH